MAMVCLSEPNTQLRYLGSSARAREGARRNCGPALGRVEVGALSRLAEQAALVRAPVGGSEGGVVAPKTLV